MGSGIARGFVLAGTGAALLYAFFSGALSGAVALVADALRTGTPIPSTAPAAGGGGAPSAPTFTKQREG